MLDTLTDLDLVSYEVVGRDLFTALIGNTVVLVLCLFQYYVFEYEEIAKRGTKSLAVKPRTLQDKRKGKGQDPNPNLNPDPNPTPPTEDAKGNEAGISNVVCNLQTT